MSTLENQCRTLKKILTNDNQRNAFTIVKTTLIVMKSAFIGWNGVICISDNKISIYINCIILV